MTPELLAQFKRNYQEPVDVENEPVGVFNDIHALINALEAALSQAEADRVDAEKWRHLMGDQTAEHAAAESRAE